MEKMPPHQIALNYLKKFFHFFFNNSPLSFIINTILIILCVAGLILAFFFVYLPSTTLKDETIVVPNLKGMQLDEVASFLASRDLRFEVMDSSFQMGQDPLSVLVQNPESNERVKPNRKIYLTVNASKPPLTNIPDIIDGSVKVANLVLESFGLRVGEVKYVDDFSTNAVLKVFHEGYEITKKEIKEGYAVEKGTKIDLEVGNGLGKSHMPVPDLIGMPLDEVEQLLLGLGLKVGQIEYKESDKEVGTVVRQSPDPAEQEDIRIGEIINIWVSGYFPDNAIENQP